MKSARKKTKNELLQERDPAGALIIGIIAFLTSLMPQTIASRLVAILYIIADLPVKRICVLSGLSEKTVRQLKKSVGNTPFHTLLCIKKGSGRKGDLVNAEEEVKKELTSKNYYSRLQIANMIWEKFRIRIRLSAVGEYLKKWGFKKLKCGSFPAKADHEKQATFCDQVLFRLLNLAKLGKIVLLSLDGSHFVYGSDFLGCVYTLARRFQATFSGRQRYNVLGAINLVSKKVHTFTNDKYINAESVCTLLREIAAAYPGQEIHIILDNAKYQKCKLVTDLAAELGITLDYIPPYSPNLNHIERLWKFVKSIIRTRDCKNYEEFKTTIDEIISGTTTVYKQKIDKLIGEKVQLFKVKQVAENTYQVDAA